MLEVVFLTLLQKIPNTSKFEITLATCIFRVGKGSVLSEDLSNPHKQLLKVLFRGRRKRLTDPA